MKALILILLLFSLTAKAEMRKTQLGKLQSRVIISKTSKADAPVIFLIPGSGANGPEEMMSPSATTDGLYHPLFVELSLKLNAMGFHAVMIGKPGIDFANADGTFKAYDKEMYLNLTWNKYLENIEDVIAEVSKEFAGNKKILLGHSEGTIAAVYLSERADYDGIIQLGYFGRNLSKILHYQASDRIIEAISVLDANQNKVLEKAEWINYPELRFFEIDNIPFQNFYDLGEVNYREFIKKYINFPLWNGDIFDGEDFYARTAALKIPLYVFQGELDVQTPASEAYALKDECIKQNKKDCVIRIIPGVGHGFSRPKSPMMDPVFDATIGPMEDVFYNILQPTLKNL